MAPPSRPVRTFLALAGVAALAATSCSAGTHSRSQGGTSTPSTTAPPPASTTEPAPVYAPSPFSWQRDTSPALDLGGGPTATLAAVLPASGSEPWAIAGTRTAATGTPSAIVWTSPGATEWTASALDASRPSTARGAARYQGATVVVGATLEGDREQASVWSSPSPGAPFANEPVPPSGGDSVMDLVTQGALGIFATGTSDGRFAMWSSTTGRRWGEVTSAEKSIASVPGTRVDALMSERDVVYAAGSVPAAGGSSAAVWSTGDGLHWRLVRAGNAFGGPGSSVIYSLARLGTGLVAVGAVNTGYGWVPASWASPDGISWSQPSTDFPGAASLPGPALGGGSAALAVSTTTSLSGATTVVASGGGPGGEGEWQSSDGLQWEPVSLPPAAAAPGGWAPTLVGTTGSEVVLADGDPGQAHVLADGPAGWSEPSANPSVFGPVQQQASPVRLASGPSGLDLEVEVTAHPQAIAAPSTTTAVLTSPDGVTWAARAGATMPDQPAALPEPGAVTARTAAGVWVGVGAAPGGYPESWTSPTGTTWSAGKPLDPASPGTGTRPAADVRGLCTVPALPAGGSGSASDNTMAAVGDTVNHDPATGASTRAASAWVTVSGRSWHRAAVSPGGASGETMTGCLDTGAGMVAYGTAAGSGGLPAPGLWRATDGSAWTRASVPAFAPGAPNPITSLSAQGTDWLAIANPSGPVRAGAETEPDGLWTSTDSGTTWQRVDLDIAPWPGTSDATVALAGFAGASAVVVGSSDGRLALWVGTPVAAGTTTASSG